MTDLESLYQSERIRLFKLNDDPTAQQADYLHPVFGVGQIASDLMIIGEAPGKEEAALGVPFVGKAGKQLDSFLNDAGLDRKKVFVTNSVKYRPVHRKFSSVSNRTPTAKEIIDSLDILSKEIEIIDPHIVATFGNSPLFAVKKIVGDSLPSGTIGELHGNEIHFQLYGKERILFPMYHPASVIYNRDLKPILYTDTLTLAKLTMSFNR